MMNIRAAKAGLRIQEVPSHELRRVHGVSNLHVFFDGWRILKVIAAEAVRYSPAPDAGSSPRWPRPRACTRAPRPPRPVTADAEQGLT